MAQYFKKKCLPPNEFWLSLCLFTKLSHSRKNSERWRTSRTSCPSYGSTSGISYLYQHFGMPRHPPSSSGTWLSPLTPSDGKVPFVGLCKSRMSPHTRSSTGSVRRTQSKFTVPPVVSPSTAWRKRTSFIPTSKPFHHQSFPPVPRLVPASCKMGTGSFQGVKCGRGVLLTTHLLLVLRSWKSRSIPLPTLWATPGL